MNRLMLTLLFGFGTMMFSLVGQSSEIGKEKNFSLAYETSQDFKNSGLGYKIFKLAGYETQLSLHIEEYIPLNEDLIDPEYGRNIRLGIGLKSVSLKGVIEDLVLSMPIGVEYYGNQQEEIRVKLGGTIRFSVHGQTIEFGNSIYGSQRLGFSSDNPDLFSVGVLSSFGIFL